MRTLNGSKQVAQYAIEQMACQILCQEKFEAAVKARVEEINAGKWWHKFVPVISIKWRK